MEHAVHPAAQAEGGWWRSACWAVGVNHVEPFNQKSERKSGRNVEREHGELSRCLEERRLMGLPLAFKQESNHWGLLLLILFSLLFFCCFAL